MARSQYGDHDSRRIVLNDGPTNTATFRADVATGNVTSTGTGTFGGDLINRR